MSKTTFDTNPISLQTLLQNCEEGKIQLPDFQRSWVWEEDRIMSLITSISRGFPMGALMSLKAKIGEGITFSCRPIEGTPNSAEKTSPEQLLLDGQQRMTSLYQSCMRQQVVSTITSKKRLVKRWFYIDIKKAIADETDRDAAIFSVPEDKKLKKNFDKDIVLDLSSRTFEYENLMYPLNQVFNWDSWQEGFGDFWIDKGNQEMRETFKQFKNNVLKNFAEYLVPVIALGADTSHEAVCLVFEKVNTGGKALDAFELLTAMYAAQGHKLRDDWLGEENAQDEKQKIGIQKAFAMYGRAAEKSHGVIANVAATDFLQAIALLHTKEKRLAAEKTKPDKENEWPAVRATRQSLLDLPLDAYKKYQEPVRLGFERAARFLRQQQIYNVRDLPYQTQLVPLAAIFADIGDKADHTTNMEKITRWYWCGVFGELYGSAVESRFAKDVLEVPIWLNGGTEPSTVKDGVMRPERLLTMRSRLSAAYKGLQALLLNQGAIDFRSGQSCDQSIFFDEKVDVHHIFPKAWCQARKIPASTYDSVVNKTPLGSRTNGILGGSAPSVYLKKLENGKKSNDGSFVDPPIEKEKLFKFLNSHAIPCEELYADEFEIFINKRQIKLLKLISDVTKNISPPMSINPEEGEELSDSIAHDSGFEIDT